MSSILDLINNQTRNNNNSNNLAQIKNLMAQMQQYSIPEMALQNLMSQNPLAKQIIEFAQGRGIGLQQVAEIMAQQKNVDLAQLVKELQS